MDQEDVKIPVMQTRSTMFRLGCGYALDGLEQNRCPECRRPFYPDSPSTYRATPHPRILPTPRTALALLLAALTIIISSAVGLILSMVLWVWLLPNYNLGFMPFIFTVWPAFTVAGVFLALRIFKVVRK